MSFWFRKLDNLCIVLWDIKYSEKLSLSLFHPHNVNNFNFHKLFGWGCFLVGWKRPSQCVVTIGKTPVPRGFLPLRKKHKT